MIKWSAITRLLIEETIIILWKLKQINAPKDTITNNGERNRDSNNNSRK
jgi:hypothetical protein